MTNLKRWDRHEHDDAKEDFVRLQSILNKEFPNQVEFGSSSKRELTIRRSQYTVYFKVKKQRQNKYRVATTYNKIKIYLCSFDEAKEKIIKLLKTGSI